MHPLRTSRHLLQLVQKSALPKVSGRSSRSLARSTSPGASPNALRPCGLHTSSSFGPLVLQNKKVIYDLLFRTSAESLLEVARDPQHLGAQIGFFSVLHTWSQQLNLHPHVHCVVPAGGLSPDHTRWVRSPDNYFLPKKVLRKVFRGKFVDALKQAFQNGQLNFHADLKLLAQPKTFAAWLRPLFRQNWVVYLKPP